MFSFFYFTQSNRKCAKLQSEKAVKTEPSCEVHLQALLSCIMHDAREYYCTTVLLYFGLLYFACLFFSRCDEQYYHY